MITVTFDKPTPCYVCKKMVMEGSIRDGADLNIPRVHLCSRCDDVAEAMIEDGKKAFE